MRKLFIILISILAILSTSCSKNNRFNNIDYGNIKYYVCGLYIEVIKDENPGLDDDNPKIYFEFENTSSYSYLNLKSGYDKNAAEFTDATRNIQLKDGYTLYLASVRMKMVNSGVTSFTLHPIYLKIDQKNIAKYEIDTEIGEHIDLNKETSYQYNVSYTYNKTDKIGVEIKLLFTKEV